MTDLRACLLACHGLLLLGCPERPGAVGDDDDATEAPDDDDATGEPCDPEGAYRCLGPEYQVCEADGWALQDRCEPPTDLCDPVLGCHLCEPDETLCVDGDVHTCDDDGLDTTLAVACPEGSECFNGGCYDPCSLAELQQSYRGCEFLAVTTLNSSLDAAFSDDFAVVVGVPPDSDPASVTVTRNGLLVASQEIPAGQTAAISRRWSTPCGSPGAGCSATPRPPSSPAAPTS